MEDMLFGVDALGGLEENGQGGDGVKFTSFSAEKTFTVKVPTMSENEDVFQPALMSFFSYGIYKVVNSFVAATPSKKSAKGYPVENLTPWDKAWKFHQDQSKKFQDFHSTEANKYRAKLRYAMVFFDLDENKNIVIDVSKDQAAVLYKVMKKYEKKHGKMAFELSKSGTGTNTVVALSPIVDMDEDLTVEQLKNFEKADRKVTKTFFDGLLFERNEDQMIAHLMQTGFDISKVGLTAPEVPGTSGEGTSIGKTVEFDEGDLPF